MVNAQMTADPTDWKYEVKKMGADKYELIFEVKLKDGWHIFSQKPGDDFIIPPSFDVKADRRVKLLGKVQEKGNLKTEKIDGIDNPVRYYESKADFVLLVSAKPGSKITGDHVYQVCNDKMCLPPKKKHFEFVIKD
jgi:thiol:disulfide interchange protein DsbD